MDSKEIMGGTALEELGFISRRISTAEYKTIIQELTNIVEDHGIQFLPVLAYKSKKDHGDIDFAAWAGQDIPSEWWRKLFATYFRSNFIKKNGFTYSVDYKGVQIDISVFDNEEAMEAYYHFCNYSPIGNVYGKMLKQFGLTYGLDGLSYKVKLSDSEEIGRIKITTSSTKIFSFGGLSINKLEEGFETQEDIFEYISDCKYFNKEIFSFENMDHASRTRDRKRPDYNAWIKYIADKENKFVENPDKSIYVDMISSHFNINLQAEINAMVALHRWKQSLTSKFNGQIVTEELGIEREALGRYIKDFKEEKAKSNNDKWFNYLEKNHPIAIRKEIRDFYKIWLTRQTVCDIL